jgi:hypothetical protein
MDNTLSAHSHQTLRGGGGVGGGGLHAISLNTIERNNILSVQNNCKYLVIRYILLP